MAVTFDVNEGTGSHIESDVSQKIQESTHWLAARYFFSSSMKLYYYFFSISMKSKRIFLNQHFHKNVVQEDFETIP